MTVGSRSSLAAIACWTRYLRSMMRLSTALTTSSLRLSAGNVGEAKFVVELLLRHVVRSDMRDNLSDDGLRLLLLAAAGKRDRAGQGQSRRGEAPAACVKIPKHAARLFS